MSTKTGAGVARTEAKELQAKTTAIKNRTGASHSSTSQYESGASCLNSLIAMPLLLLILQSLTTSLLS